MVEVKSAAWDLEQEIFLTKLNQAAVGEGPWPLNIVSHGWIAEADSIGRPHCPAFCPPGIARARQDVPPGCSIP